MKLNKTEMKIIAKRLATSIHEADEAARKAAIAIMDQDNQTKAENLLKELKGLSLCARRLAFGQKYNSKKIDMPTVETILRKLRDDSKLPDVRNHWQTEGEVLDELILCNSSAEDRDSLIGIVSRKFGITI